MTSVTIPAGVTFINDYAFNNRPSSLVLNVVEGSYAESFAQSKGITYTSTRLYDYTVSGNYTTITHYNGTQANVCIPETLDNCPVIVIGESAFSGNNSVRNVIFPDTVTSIGSCAFSGCTNLESIRILRPVQSISENAFSGCTNLIIFGKKGSYAETYADSQDIPFTLYSIILYSGACGTNCQYTIDDDWCMRIWGTGTTTGGYYTGLNNQLNQVNSVVIEEGVTGIAGNAFYNDFTLLREISIPQSVVSIGNYAFYKCSNLTSISLPDNLESVGTNPFLSCPAVRYASLDSKGAKTLSKADLTFRVSGTESDIRYIFADDEVTGLELVSCNCTDSSFVIPDYVTRISSNAFQGCDNLTCLTIPGSVAEIDSFSLSRCVNLDTVILQDGITTILPGAFQNCANLTNISIPDTVISIGNSAFYGCSSLSEIILPANVSETPNSFSNCSAVLYASLNSITARTLSENNYAFRVPDTDCDVKYTTYYGGETGIELISFNTEIDSLVIPDFVTHLKYYVFSDPGNVKSVTFPATNLYFSSTSDLSNLEELHCVSCDSSAYSTFINSSSLKDKVILDNPHTLVTIDEIPATCTQAGSTEGTKCTKCRRIMSGCETIPKLAHTVVVDAAVPATDTEPGLTEGSHCSVCNTVIVAQQQLAPLWDIEIVNNTVSIVKYNGSLSNVSIPSSINEKNVTEIRDGAFASSSCPIRIYIPKTVTAIGYTAFARKTTIYCHRFSEADYWADEVGYSKVYTDNAASGDFYIVQAPAEFRLECGNSRQLAATVWPITGAEQMIWTSSNPDVVSVENDTVTALRPGCATITLQVGANTASLEVTAYAYPSEFNLSENDAYAVTGIPFSLSVEEVVPEGAEIEITWSTSDSRIVEVDQSGTVTPKRIGSATVHATSQNGVVRDCTVTVCYPVDSVTFATSNYAINTQEEVQVAASVQTDDCTYQNRLVIFSSSDELVATVNRNGIVTGHNKGTAEITATAVNDPTVRATTMVTINCPDHVSEIYSPAVEPTCEEDGATVGLYCPYCGLIIQGPAIVPALGHNYNLVEEAPADVGRSGYLLYECANCRGYYYDTLEPLQAGYQLIGKKWKPYMAFKPPLLNVDVFDKSLWPSGYQDMYLEFTADGKCTYRIVNTRGSLVYGTSTWSLNNKDLYIPSLNTSIGLSSSSQTGLAEMSGIINIMFFTNSKSYFVYFSPDGERLTADNSPYLGTWRADHIIRPATGLRVSSEHWPSINATTIVIKEDNTLTINGNEGTWACSYTDHAFYVDGEQNILQFNDMGQMVFWLGDGDFLILTRNNTGKLSPRKMILPSGLKTIDEDAFEYTAAQEIVIPKGCKTIKSKAFAHSKSLYFVLIPSSVSLIADDAFEGCNITICAAENSYAWRWAQDHHFTVIQPE